MKRNKNFVANCPELKKILNDIKEAKRKDIPSRISALGLFLVRVVLRLACLAVCVAIGWLLIVVGALGFGMFWVAGFSLIMFFLEFVTLTMSMEHFIQYGKIILSFGALCVVGFALFCLIIWIHIKGHGAISTIKLSTQTPHLDAIVNPVREQVIKDQESYREHFNKSFDEIFAIGLDVVANGKNYNRWWICTPEQGAILRTCKKHRDWR